MQKPTRNEGHLATAASSPASLDISTVTVREAVIRLLRGFDMTTVFGNPGSTELPLYRNWPDDFRYILGLQEAVVVAMADGYAQATRNASFVNLHSAAEFPKPYVKWSVEPARAQDVPAAIARAYYTAMQPPAGPTFVSIPVDDWDQTTEIVHPRRVSFRLRPDPRLLSDLGDAIEASQRPAFVVGAGVDRNNAWDLVVGLAERIGATVWASPKSSRCSFTENHPQFAGFLPPERDRIAAL